MVQVVVPQVAHPGHPAQPVDAGQLGGGDAGEDLVAAEQQPVQPVALQHHLVAQHPVVVEKEAVAKVAVHPHHGEQPVCLGGVGSALGHLQPGGVTRAGLGHLHRKADGLPGVAPAALHREGDLVHLPRHQADELELMGAGVLFAGDVRRPGGEVRQPLHPHGVAHRGGKFGLKIEVQAVAAGAIGVQDGQGHGGGPLQVGVVFQFLHHLPQPLLHLQVVVGEILLPDVLRHQLQGFQPAAQVRLGQIHLPLAALGHHVAGGKGPVGAGGLLPGGEGLGHLHHHQGGEECQHQQHRAGQGQPFPVELGLHGESSCFTPDSAPATAAPRP